MVFDQEISAKVIPILQNCIDADVQDFATAYNKFHSESVGKPSGLVLWKRDEFSLKADQPQYPNAFNIGVDLPIYFDKVGNTKTVVLLGEDPLRSKKELEIVISTPFALHLPQLKFPSHKILRWIVTELLSMGYNVYVTDIFKAWVKGGEHKIDFFKDKIFFQNSLQCLQSEFGLLMRKNEESSIQVITLGGKAKRAFTKMKDGGSLKNFAHKDWNHPAAWVKEKHKYFQNRLEELACKQEIS